MRFLMVLAATATLGWGGYWGIGSWALERALATGLAGVREITLAGHGIAGFPGRFVVTLDQPVWQSDGFVWSAPFVRVFAPSYRLTHVNALLAPEQRLSVAGLDAQLHHADLRIRLLIEPRLDLPLNRVTLDGRQLALSVAGQTHHLGGLRASSRRVDARGHELMIALETLVPDPALMDLVDPGRLWPRRIDMLRLEAQVRLDRALDRHALGGQTPQLETLTLTGARATWEGVDIVATGALEPEPDGRLSGSLALSVSGWQSLMQSARSSGLIEAEHDILVAIAAQGLISADNPNQLEVVFSVVDGAIYWGPFLVAEVPALF